MGRSDQQTIGEGEKLDLQIPQPSGDTYPDQSGSTSNSDLYDVSVSFSQMNRPKNKSHPKGLTMARSGKKEKWALVACEKVCKPKFKGGLGLQDPQVTNKAYGKKLWWRWVKENSTPWKTLWKAKYAPDINDQDRIRFMGTREGSSIWNLSWRNKTWIQKHSFWEVRNGNIARFWEDVWQQEPRMENTDREELQQAMTTQGKIKIHHYWKQKNSHDKWRIWDKLNPQNRDRIAKITKEVEEELGKRKIVISEEEDQLIWGRKNGGEFNLKEARKYIADQDQEDPMQQWRNIWGNLQWPKIKIFK
jgi:hypothetical protein